MNRQVRPLAPRCGSIGPPASWEASVMGDALRAAVGHDEWNLWRHRTEPVTVVLNPERILVHEFTKPSRYLATKHSRRPTDRWIEAK
jgi:hypothetical protein